jgi:hypothetical protein
VRSEGLGVFRWLLRGVGKHPLLAVIAVLGAWGLSWAVRTRVSRHRGVRGRVPGFRDHADVPSDLVDLLGEVERHWAKCGVARPASRALLDHLERVIGHAGDSERRQVERNIVQRYYAVRFGASSIEPDAVAALASRWRETAG